MRPTLRRAISGGLVSLCVLCAGFGLRGSAPALSVAGDGLRPLAISLQAGFSQQKIVGGLNLPTGFTFLPDGRVLVAEKAGLVRMVKDGKVLSQPFLDIRSRVNSTSDCGIPEVAADPDFASNGFVYVLYCYENNASNPTATKTARLARFTASGDTAPAGSEVAILGSVVGSSCNNFAAGTDCIPADSRSHTGGRIAFAPDKTMFVTLGDGGHCSCVTDNALRAQNLDLLSGKLLHVTRSGQGLPSNPFWNGNADANRSKVWAYGLRNPFRMTLRPGSGIPYLGDVGWRTWEEIDVAPAGANLGWPCYEGTPRQSGYAPKATCQALYDRGAGAVKAPLVSYRHSDFNEAASVTGGPFYTGTVFPSAYQGAYFYGDYVNDFIRYLRVDGANKLVSGPTTFATGADGPVDIQTGADGSLYYLSIKTGELRRIFFAGSNRPPTAVAAANPTNGLAPLDVEFTGSSSSDADGDSLTHSWDFGDATPTSSEANPLHTYDADGTYVAALTVSDGRGGSSSDTVQVVVGNRAPTATIDEPLSSHRYQVGEVITFSGSGSDPEDLQLTDDALSWQVNLQHCPGGGCHVHPSAPATGGSGSFTVDDHGDDTFLEIVLTVTDSGGLKDTEKVTIQPQTVQVTLATSPSGLEVVYDGTSGSAPLTQTTIVGSAHTIGTLSPQGSATFASWSDGGAQQHDVTIGSSNTTFTATFDAPAGGFSVSHLSLTNGQTVSGAVRWEAAVAGASVTRVEFLIDDKLRWTEKNSPYVFNGDTGTWDTTQETDGPHTLGLRAVASNGSVTTNSVGVSVSNGGGGGGGGGTSTTAFPEATTILTGKLRGGAAAQLGVDDNSYYQVNSTTSGTRTTAWYGSFFAIPNELTSLSVTYKGKNSASCSQTVALWRWSTGSWVQVDSRSVGTSEASITKSPSGTLADYVSGDAGPGELRVRVRCKKGSNFFASGDLLRVVYGTPLGVTAAAGVQRAVR